MQRQSTFRIYEKISVIAHVFRVTVPLFAYPILVIMYGTPLAITKLNSQWVAVQIAKPNPRMCNGKISEQ